MRYTTAPFGETVRLLGRFTSGRLATQVQLVLVNLETNAVQPITTPNCTEVTGSAFGGRSAYLWPTSNIVTQPTVKTEFLYVMTDTVTGQVQEGKVVLGGYPDQAARVVYESAVHIDPAIGVPLSTPGVFEFPIGTPGTPVNNEADARTIADFLGIRIYHVNGTLTLTVDHENWSFEGEEPRQDVIVVSPGVSVADSSFSKIGIRGTLSGTISASQCLVGPTVGGTLGVDGVFTDCGFQGTIRPAAGSTIRGLRINWLDLTNTVLDFANPGSVTLFLARCSGNFEVRNANVNTLMGVVLEGGQVTHAASIVNSTSFLYGFGERVDLATSWLLDTDAMIRGSRVDVETSSRAAPGDAMDLVTDALDAAAVAASGAAEIADAVLDEAVGDHLAAGSLGDAARQLLNGLVARARINTATSPWTEEHYVWASGGPPDSVVFETYELFDQDGVAIAGTAAAGNNPLANPTRLIAERRRV